MQTLEGEVIYSKPPVKTSRKLTRKQAQFVKELKKDPKITPTEAARRAYKGVTDKTARVVASKNMQNSKIISHLSAFNDIAETTIHNAISDFGNSPDIKERTLAVDTAKWVHDKNHGKAVQKSENTTLTISIEQLLNNLK